jgi:pentatricopeptide repeat protein
VVLLWCYVVCVIRRFCSRVGVSRQTLLMCCVCAQALSACMCAGRWAEASAVWTLMERLELPPVRYPA